jgi:hypothetical protein
LRSLRLQKAFDAVVFSDELGRGRRKPHPAPLVRAARLLRVDPARCVYIGDRPEKDVAAALAARMRSVRVRTGEYARAPDLPRAWMTVRDVPSAASRLADLIDRPAWPPQTTTHCVVAGADLTASVLERTIPGAAKRAARLGIALELAVTLSGPASGVAAGAATLARAGCSSGEATRGGSWIRLSDFLLAAICNELVPPPRPAGVDIDLALHAAGDASALPAVLDALGASASARRAIAPLLDALAEADTRRTHRVARSARLMPTG